MGTRRGYEKDDILAMRVGSIDLLVSAAGDHRLDQPIYCNDPISIGNLSDVDGTVFCYRFLFADEKREKGEYHSINSDRPVDTTFCGQSVHMGMGKS